MQRVWVGASMLGVLVGCSSVDTGGPATAPVETVELTVATSPPVAASASAGEKPPLERAPTVASAPAPAPPPPLPPLPGLANPPPLVASSTTKPAPTTELTKLDAALDAAVARDAQGLVLDGGTLGGRFVQGDVLERSLMILPGHCYTVVAESRGGITELDVALVTAVAPAMPPMILAIDADQGPSATLGRMPACFKNPLPIAMPVLVRATAKSGAGTAAFRVLSR